LSKLPSRSYSLPPTPYLSLSFVCYICLSLLAYFFHSFSNLVLLCKPTSCFLICTNRFLRSNSPPFVAISRRTPLPPAAPPLPPLSLASFLSIKTSSFHSSCSSSLALLLPQHLLLRPAHHLPRCRHRRLRLVPHHPSSRQRMHRCIIHNLPHAL